VEEFYKYTYPHIH